MQELGEWSLQKDVKMLTFLKNSCILFEMNTI